jgi:transposase-like protein
MEGRMSALSIRRDRTPTVLRKLAKGERDARITRRILAIANALDGMSREEAAQAAGMDRQTLRDWVIRYNEDGLDGLADRARDGRPPKLDAEEKAELYRLRARRPGSGGERPFGLHARGPGAHLQEAVRQEPARNLNGSHPARARAFATKGAAQPPGKGPGRTGGL